MRHSRCAALALLPVLSGIGCGGASQSSSVPASVSGALVHAAFVDRADRICTRGRARLILTGNHYFGDLPPGRNPSAEAVTSYARRQAVPILKRQYGHLQVLKPPPGDSRTVHRILDLADLGIRQLERDPTLLNRGSGVPPGLERARLRAYRYGLGACGQQIEIPTNGGTRIGG
jgi:hypothetical protein